MSRGAAPVALAAALALGSAAFAENKAPSLEDKRQTVKIGFARLAGTDLDPDQATLADTIPLRLVDLLASLDYRQLPAEESKAYRDAALAAKLSELGLKLDDSIEQYDLKILSEKGPDEARSARQALKGGIEASRKDLESYSGLDPASVKSPERKAIEWSVPSQGSKLYPYPLAGAQAFCVSQDIDILVAGSLTGSSGYAFLEIYAYHRYLGKRVFEWKTALAQDDSAAAINEFSRGLAEALLGRATTSLLVKAAPSRAEVRIDGKFAGNAPYTSPFTLPGKHEILVSSPGYADVAATVELEEGKSLEKSFELPSLNLGSVAVGARPEGAAVYAEATKAGETPIELPVVEDPRSIRLKAAGYRDEIIVIPGGSAKPVTAILAEKGEAEKNSFAKQRDRFYLSAGAFMVSLPVSVLCAGMFNQYYQNLSAVQSSGLSDDQAAAANRRMEGPFYAWQTATWASCGVSAGLLGFCIYRFALYLGAAK